MKTKSLFLILTFLTFSVQAQLINNKGNRLQTYPKIAKVNPQIKSYIDEVSVDSLENSIRWMQDLGCRDAQSIEAVQTQNWLVEKYESYGLEVYIHLFSCEAVRGSGKCTAEPCDGDTLQAGNVVAVQYGTEFPDEFIILSCHYDHPDGPGADDNASGTAGVLECARILSQYSFKRSIMYVSFNAEEYWMVGSVPFVEKCAREDLNILGVFNLDMIGYFPDSIRNLTMYSGYSPITENLFDYYENTANLYLPDIPTYIFSDKDSYGGDHIPFHLYNYPAIYIGDIEYINTHPCYHKPCDTLGMGVNNMNLVKAYTQASLASVAELTNAWLPPQRFSTIIADEYIMLSWDKASEVSKYIIYKNGNKLKETGDTFYIDTDVREGELYKYNVTSIHSKNSEESVSSNYDIITMKKPLELPYSDNFEKDMVNWNSEHESWIVTNQHFYEGSFSLTNKEYYPQYSLYPNNYRAVVELNWFSIPSSIEHAALKFYLKGFIGSTAGKVGCNLYVEITNDRKTWDKLFVLGNLKWLDWRYLQVSLDKYIGNPFSQIRFRIESSGSIDQWFEKQVFVDNVQITYDEVIEINKEEHVFSQFNIYPNPSDGVITIDIDKDTQYRIDVYNVLGTKVFQKENNEHKNINLSHLPKGVYFIKISTQNESIAKRIVIHR